MHPKMKAHQAQMQIRTQLQGLPAPMNEVEISMPELQQDDLPIEEPLEEDAADADRRRERMEVERKEQERLKQRQCSVGCQDPPCRRRCCSSRRLTKQPHQ